MRVFLLLALLLTGITERAFATLSSCNNTIGINNYPAGNNPSGGCGSVDLGYDNLTATGGNGAAGVNLFSGDPGAPVGSTMPQISADFSSNNWFLTTAGTKNFTVSYTVQVIGGNGTGTQGFSPPAPFTTWAITGLALDFGNNQFTAAGDSATVKQFICLDTLTACTAGTSDGFTMWHIFGTGSNEDGTFTNCTPVDGGSCTTTTSNGSVLPMTLPHPVTEMSFFTMISITEGGASIAIDWADNFSQTAETPEPATFALAGAALLFLLLGRRLRDHRLAIALRPGGLNLLVGEIGHAADQNEGGQRAR